MSSAAHASKSRDRARGVVGYSRAMLTGHARELRLLLTAIVMAMTMATAACSTTYVDSARIVEAAPVDPATVRILARLPAEHPNARTVALFKATSTNDEELRGAIRLRAGRLGAQAVIVDEVSPLGSGRTLACRGVRWD